MLFVPLLVGLGYKATRFLVVWGPRVYTAGSLYFTLSGTKKDISNYFELRVGSPSYNLEELILNGNEGPGNLPFTNIAGQHPCRLDDNGQLRDKDNAFIPVDRTQYFFDGENIFLAVKKDNGEATEFIAMRVPDEDLKGIQSLENSDLLSDDAQECVDDLFMKTEEAACQRKLEEAIVNYPDQWKYVIQQLKIAMDKLYEGQDYTIWEEFKIKIGTKWNEDASAYMHCLDYMIKMHHIDKQYTLLKNAVSPPPAFVAGGAIAETGDALQDYEQAEWYRTGDPVKLTEYRDSLKGNLEELEAIEQKYNERKAINLNSKNGTDAAISITRGDTREIIKSKIDLRMRKDFPKPSFWESVRKLFSFILGPTPYMQVHKLLFEGVVKQDLETSIDTEFRLEEEIKAEKERVQKEIALTNNKIDLVAEVQKKITAEKDAIQEKAIELNKNIGELKELKTQLDGKKVPLQEQAALQEERIKLVAGDIEKASALQKANGDPVVATENISAQQKPVAVITNLNIDIEQLLEAVSIGGLEKEIEAVYKNAALITPIEVATVLSSAAAVVVPKIPAFSDVIPEKAADFFNKLANSVTEQLDTLRLKATEEKGNTGSVRLAELKTGKEQLGKKELEINSVRDNLNNFENALDGYPDKLNNAEADIAAYEAKGLEIVNATIPVLMQSILIKIRASKDAFSEAKAEAEENPFFDKEKLKQAFENRNAFLEKLQECPGFDANNAVFQSFLKLESEPSADNEDWGLQLEDKMQELTTRKVKAAVQELQNKISEGLKAIQDLQAIMAGKEHSYEHKVKAVWEAIEKLEGVLKEIDGLMAGVEKATKEARENKAQAEKLKNEVETWAKEAEETKKKAREKQRQEATSRVGLFLTRAEKAKDSIEKNKEFLQGETTGETALAEANAAIENIKNIIKNITLPVEDSVVLKAEQEAEKAEATAKSVIHAAAVEKVAEAQQAQSEIKQIFESVQAAQKFVQETFSALTDSSASKDFGRTIHIQEKAVAVIVDVCAKKVVSAKTNCTAAEDSSRKLEESTMQESYTRIDSIKQSVGAVTASLKEAQEQAKLAGKAKEQSEKLRAHFQDKAGASSKNTGAVLYHHLSDLSSDDLKTVTESVLEKVEESEEMVSSRDLSEQLAREAIAATEIAIDLSKALLQKIETSSDTLTHLYQDIQKAVDAGNFPEVQRIHESAMDSNQCNEQQYNLMLAAILMGKAHSMLHAKAEIAHIVRLYQEGEQDETKRQEALTAIEAQEAKIKNMGYIATELQNLNAEAINVTLSQLLNSDVPALLVEHDGQRLYGKEFDSLLVNLQELALDVEILKLGLSADEDRGQELSMKKKMREKREYDLAKEEALANNLRIAALLTSIKNFNTDKLDDAGILSSVVSTFGEILGTSKKSDDTLALFSWVKNFINGSNTSPTLEFMIELLNRIQIFQKNYQENEAALKWSEETRKILYALLGINILAKKLDRINVEIYKSHFKEINRLFNELCQSQPSDMADKLKLLQSKISTFDDRLATIEPADMAKEFYSAHGLQWPFSSKVPTAAEVIHDIIEQAKRNYPQDSDASYTLCSSLRLEMRVHIQQPKVQRKDDFKEWLFESWQALVEARDASVGKTVDEDFIQEEVNAKINKAIADFYEENSLALSFPESNLTPAVIMKCFMGQAPLQDKKPHEVHKQYKELRKVVKKLRDEDPNNKMYYEKWLRASRLVELGECRDKGLGMFVRPASIPSTQVSASSTGTQSGGVIKRKLGVQQ